MRGSFATIAEFEERGLANGTMLPLHGAEVDTNVIPIPGGVIIYLQVGKPKAVRVAIPAQVTALQRDSLKFFQGVRDSLVYSGGDVGATLEEVQEPKLVKQGYDVFEVVLIFVL